MRVTAWSVLGVMGLAFQSAPSQACVELFSPKTVSSKAVSSKSLSSNYNIPTITSAEQAYEFFKTELATLLQNGLIHASDLKHSQMLPGKDRKTGQEYWFLLIQVEGDFIPVFVFSSRGDLSNPRESEIGFHRSPPQRWGHLEALGRGDEVTIFDLPNERIIRIRKDPDSHYGSGFLVAYRPRDTLDIDTILASREPEKRPKEDPHNELMRSVLKYTFNK